MGPRSWSRDPLGLPPRLNTYTCLLLMQDIVDVTLSVLLSRLVLCGSRHSSTSVLKHLVVRCACTHLPQHRSPVAKFLTAVTHRCSPYHLIRAVGLVGEKSLSPTDSLCHQKYTGAVPRTFQGICRYYRRADAGPVTIIRSPHKSTQDAW